MLSLGARSSPSVRKACGLDLGLPAALGLRLDREVDRLPDGQARDPARHDVRAGAGAVQPLPITPLNASLPLSSFVMTSTSRATAGPWLRTRTVTPSVLPRLHAGLVRSAVTVRSTQGSTAVTVALGTRVGGVDEPVAVVVDARRRTSRFRAGLRRRRRRVRPRCRRRLGTTAALSRLPSVWQPGSASSTSVSSGSALSTSSLHAVIAPSVSSSSSGCRVAFPRRRPCGSPGRSCRRACPRGRRCRRRHCTRERVPGPPH